MALASLWLGPLLGCAVVETQPRCGCSKCQQMYQQHPGVEGDPVVADLKRAFDHLVIGVEYQKELEDATPTASSKQSIRKPSRSRAVNDLHGPLSSLASDSVTPAPVQPQPPGPELLPAVPPMEASAKPPLLQGEQQPYPARAKASAAESCSAQQMAPPMYPPAGPAPRFFPVPARPVFSADSTQPCFR